MSSDRLDYGDMSSSETTVKSSLERYLENQPSDPRYRPYVSAPNRRIHQAARRIRRDKRAAVRRGEAAFSATASFPVSRTLVAAPMYPKPVLPECSDDDINCLIRCLEEYFSPKGLSIDAIELRTSHVTSGVGYYFESFTCIVHVS